MLGPLRVVGLKTVVEAGADLGILALETGLLLNEAGQLDRVVERGAPAAMASARAAVLLANSLYMVST